MKACVKEIFGSDSLQGRAVAIQGLGKVGSHLARHLHDEGVNIIAGGIINLSLEFTGYNSELARARVAEIHHTVEKVIALAKLEQISNARAADRLALDRIEEARRVRKI